MPIHYILYIPHGIHSKQDSAKQSAFFAIACYLFPDNECLQFICAVLHRDHFLNNGWYQQYGFVVSLLLFRVVSVGASRRTEGGRGGGQDNPPGQQPAFVHPSDSTEPDYNSGHSWDCDTKESTRRSVNHELAPASCIAVAAPRRVGLAGTPVRISCTRPSTPARPGLLQTRATTHSQFDVPLARHGRQGVANQHWRPVRSNRHGR